MITRLLTQDGRRALAFLALLGGAAVMTGFAAYGVYQLRAQPGFVFWLALAAHAQVAICLTAFAGLLVKRTIKVSRDGAEFTDQGSVTDA
jgi:hypothetical protein